MWLTLFYSSKHCLLEAYERKYKFRHSTQHQSLCVFLFLMCRAGENWKRLQLWAGGESSVRDWRSLRYGSCPASHEQGPLCWLPGRLSRDGTSGGQEVVEVHPQREFQRWVSTHSCFQKSSVGILFLKLHLEWLFTWVVSKSGWFYNFKWFNPYMNDWVVSGWMN